MEQKRLVRNILRLYEGYSLSMLQVGTSRQTRSIVSIVALGFFTHNICGCDSRAKSTTTDVKPQENKNTVAGGEKEAQLTSPKADDWFEDVTSQTGLRFQYRSGRESELRTILETVGGLKCHVHANAGSIHLNIENLLTRQPAKSAGVGNLSSGARRTATWRCPCRRRCRAIPWRWLIGRVRSSRRGVSATAHRWRRVGGRWRCHHLRY